jgi:hypothetical protein
MSRAGMRVPICRLLFTFSAVCCFAAPIPIGTIVHESVENFFSAGGTSVTDCIGLGCPDVAFTSGPVSGTVLFSIREKITQTSTQTSFLYSLLNETLPEPITAFAVENAGIAGTGQPPANWTFMQGASSWTFRAADPAFGIEAPFFLDFEVDVPGLVPVGFGSTSIGLASVSALTSSTWITSSGVPEPLPLLLVGSGVVNCLWVGAWQRRRRYVRSDF